MTRRENEASSEQESESKAQIAQLYQNILERCSQLEKNEMKIGEEIDTLSHLFNTKLANMELSVVNNITNRTESKPSI